MSVKQVIVMRKFKNMRTGKYIAQGAHASNMALLSALEIQQNLNVLCLVDDPVRRAELQQTANDVDEWLGGNYRKVVVYVETEAELVKLHELAMEARLPTSLIRDDGLTEFHGVPTITAVGIGPASDERINAITGALPLF